MILVSKISILNLVTMDYLNSHLLQQDLPCKKYYVNSKPTD